MWSASSLFNQLGLSGTVCHASLPSEELTRPVVLLFDAGLAQGDDTVQWWREQVAALPPLLASSPVTGALGVDVAPLLPLHMRLAPRFSHTQSSWQHADLARALAAHGCPATWRGGLWLEGLHLPAQQQPPENWAAAQAAALRDAYGRAFMAPGEHVIHRQTLDDPGEETPRPAAAAAMLLRYVAACTRLRNKRLQLSGIHEPVLVWHSRAPPDEALVHLLTFLDLRWRTAQRDEPCLPAHLWLRVGAHEYVHVTALYMALRARTMDVCTLLLAVRLKVPRAGLDAALEALAVELDPDSFAALAYHYCDRAKAVAWFMGQHTTTAAADAGCIDRALFDTFIGAPATTFFFRNRLFVLKGLYTDGPHTGYRLVSRPIIDGSGQKKQEEEEGNGGWLDWASGQMITVVCV